MTAKEIRDKGYRKLTADDMTAYLEENATAEQLNEYLTAAYAYTKKVFVKDASGNFVYTDAGRISEKTGKAIKPRRRTQIVKIDDEKEIAKLVKAGKEKTFLAFDAKQKFCALFFEDLLPKAKEDANEPKKTMQLYDKLAAKAKELSKQGK